MKGCGLWGYGYISIYVLVWYGWQYVCVGGEREGWAEAGCVASCDSHLPLE